MLILYQGLLDKVEYGLWGALSSGAWLSCTHVNIFFFYQLSQRCSEKLNTGCILVIKLCEIASLFIYLFFKRKDLNMLLLRLGSSSWAQVIFMLPNLLSSRTAHCKSITTAEHSLYSTCGLTQRLASNSERHHHHHHQSWLGVHIHSCRGAGGGGACAGQRSSSGVFLLNIETESLI